MVSDDWERVWNDSDMIKSRKTTETSVTIGDVKPGAYRIEVQIVTTRQQAARKLMANNAAVLNTYRAVS